MKTSRAIALWGLLLFVTSSVALWGQVRAVGEVRDAERGEGVAFASVSLVGKRDSSLVLRAVSDMSGGYLFERVKVGVYRLRIQSMGYKPLEREIRIVLPSDGSGFVRLADSLKQEDQTLSEVVVKGVSTRQMADRRVVKFDSQTVKGALHSYELLKSLPALDYDLMHDQLRGKMGGSVQLLINGVKATKNDVRMIPKDKIRHVELYDIPPAKYQGVESVVNIITYPLDDGYIVGGRLSHALSAGFANDDLYGSLLRGKHKISLEYHLNYRNYKDRDRRKEYQYSLLGGDHRLIYDDHGRFGYTTHSPEIKYAYLEDQKRLLELRLRPSFETRFDHAQGTGVYTIGGLRQPEINTREGEDMRQFNPSLDLYYWTKLGEKDELRLNAVLTHFQVRRHTSSVETEGAQGQLRFEDVMHLDNSKQSLILEASHSKAFGTSEWNSGYRAELASLRSEVDNPFGLLDYRSRTAIHYGYSELSGRYKKLLYRLSLGLTYTTNRSDYRTYHNWAFTSKAVLGYTLGRRSTLRLTYEEAPRHPEINELSSNRQFLTKDIVRSGNPLLENELTRQVVGLYTYQHKLADITLIGAYQHTDNPIVSEIETEGQRYVLKSANGMWERGFSAGAVLDLRPLSGSNALKLRLMVLKTRGQLRSDWINYTLSSVMASSSLTYTYKNLQMSYKYTHPAYDFSNGDARRMEQEHTLGVNYRFGRFVASASLFFIGRSAYYHSYSLGSDLVRESRERWIHDNKNMVTLGISYHFGTGKDKSYTKQLNNQDTATPTL